MKGPATELIHAGEVDRIAAVPLTTPIYETTTFVFDNAEEVRAYNEGRSRKYLYSRDATFLEKKEKNGQQLFWARGNGWVLGGLAQVLQIIPANDPMRARYVTQFKEMATRIAGLQQPDGLWKTGLLDPEAYNSSEVSGTAFFTYAMAWGMNNAVLDSKMFKPVVEKAWAGMLTHIYADGRLGSIQPIGAAPDAFTASSSYVYGVGGFLMAGSELDKIAKGAGATRKR